MALSKSIHKTAPGFDGELIATNVYFKVVLLTGSKSLISASVTGTSDGILVYNQDHSFQPDLDGDNFIKQAYLHLKTLPEFADAVDC